MYYRVYLELTPGTQQFRQFLRDHDFFTYRRDLIGVSKDNGEAKEPDMMHCYECYYNGTEKLSPDVEKKINEEMDKGNVIEYRTTIVAKHFPPF